MIPALLVNEEREQVIRWAYELAREGFIVLDTETVGLSKPYICQIGMVSVRDGESTVIMDQLIRPPAADAWEKKAIEIHGIKPCDVEYSFSIEAVWTDILRHTSRSKNLVMYNRAFDTKAIATSLKGHGINMMELPFEGRWVWPTGAAIKCAMLAYAQYVGEKRNGNGANRWQKLPDYGHGAHTAIGDCLSTADLILELASKQKTP